MRTNVGSYILALAWVLLLWTPALAQDNHGNVTDTTLTGTATNYGTVTNTTDNTHGMSSGAGETSTNAASGSITTSGNLSSGIYSSGDTPVNAGSITTSGALSCGINSSGGGTVTNTGSITTLGNSGYGIYSIRGTAVNAGSIATSGTSGYGIYSTNGGTITNTGSITTLGDSGYGINSSGGGTVTNTGSIATSGSAGYGIESTDGGTASNTGSITTSGQLAHGIDCADGGTVYNSGTISASGTNARAVRAYGASIHLQTGTRILAGDVYSYTPSGQTNHLFLDGSGSVDFNITGAWADLAKTGVGTWTFDRAVTGTINALNLQGGTLAVASGVGLNITGNYVQTAGTILLVAPDGATTPLAVTGTASLAGTLDLGVSADYLGATFTVLTAGGGLGGTTFDAVGTNPNFSLSATYTATAVTVTPTFTPQWDAPSMGLSSTLVSTQGFSSVASFRGFQLLAQADQADDSQDREILVASVGSLDGLLNPRAEETRWGVYLQPMYGTGSRDADGSIGYDWNMAGFEAGLDYRLAPDLLIGVMGGYGSTALEFTGSAFVENDTEDQDMATLGLYAGWGPGPWRITDVLSIGRVEHDSSRNAGLGQTAEANYDSWVWANRLQAAYVWVPAESWEITPRLGLSTIHVDREAFEETGATNAVRYDDFDQTFWEGSLGVRAAYSFDVEKATITPYAGIGYSRDLDDNDVTVRQYLAATSARVTTENDDDRLTTEAGLTLAKAPLALTLSWNGEFSDNTESHGLTATLRWEF